MAESDSTNGKRLVDHILAELNELNNQVGTLRVDLATVKTLLENLNRSEDRCREEVDERLAELEAAIERVNERQNTMVTWLRGITIAYGVLTAIFIVLALLGDVLLVR